jgi:histidinol dehydrogenase
MTTTFPGLPRIDLRDPADGGARDLWRRHCSRAAGISGEADEAAARIIAEVRARGDEAVVELTRRFEGRKLDRLELDRAAWLEAAARAPTSVRAALEDAIERVRRFHRTQLQQTTSLDRDGARLSSRVSALRRVAMYVPGGTAAYPSSVVMSGVPAKVAGVNELFMLTPRPTDEVLLAAELIEIDRIFVIGGAQAIAAAAIGTEQVPRVDKIVGPGNAYVTAAKRQVYGLCDIDSIAGPSEILIVADDGADPGLAAADLISQAEHDTLACAVLVTTSPDLVERVDAALREQLTDLPRRDMAIEALTEHGAGIIVDDRGAMIAAANAYAPEHLELLVEDAAHMAEKIHSAGAIFVGPWTPEAAGDYTAGPSHVLPTAGAARFASPLGVWDFVKYTSILELAPDALRQQAEAIVTLARAEGLEGHARAVERRIRS